LFGLQDVHQIETHTKRQATQHSCLPSLLGDGNTGTEIVYGERKKKIFYWAEQSSQGRAKIYCTGMTSQIKEGPLSFVLFESPFTSV
jgi:hypothetical protein